MGFSHAVLIAQSGHLHVVYSSGALRPEDSILELAEPSVPSLRPLHGIIIDDFFQFSRNRKAAEYQFNRVLEAYRAIGFIVKDSKVVRPTSNPIKVIGLEICGLTSTVALSPESQFALMQTTISALRRGHMTGTEMSHLIGKWTWCMLVRRASLSILQQVYQFIAKARRRRFTIWPSVRRELWMLLGILPLLHARLDSPFFHRTVASDASEYAGGVVSTALTPSMHSIYWPLCSNRNNAYTQTQYHSAMARLVLEDSVSNIPEDMVSLVHDGINAYDNFYSHIGSTSWSTIISRPWRNVEHINSLELRAVLLAVHWLLSYPSSLSRRVYLLVDSTVTFYSLWKGRSSSTRLLLLLRKIGALLLASGISLLPGWIPSEVNPADEPSRPRPSSINNE